MTLVEKIRQNNARWKIFLKCNFQFLGGSPCIEYCKYEKEENTNVINFAGYSKCVGVTEEETDRRKGKGRRCCLWDVLEWCNSHLRAARTIWSKVFEQKTHPFWEGCGLVWCEPDDHPFFWSNYSAKRLFVYLSLSSNHPAAKSEVRHEIKWILTPIQQGWPLPSLLSVSSSMVGVLFHINW